MNKQPLNISLVHLQSDDREQFIIDNQRAFLYGATKEFGMRNDHFEADNEIISRDTIEASIDGENAIAFRILLDGEKAGGAVITIDKKHHKGELELLFVNPIVHSRGIGYAAWCQIEKMHPDITIWETCTPYFEKRNIHFYVNRCSFHIVEYFNRYHHNPNYTESGEDNDEMFLFRKVMDGKKYD